MYVCVHGGGGGITWLRKGGRTACVFDVPESRGGKATVGSFRTSSVGVVELRSRTKGPLGKIMLGNVYISIYIMIIIYYIILFPTYRRRRNRCSYRRLRQ